MVRFRLSAFVLFGIFQDLIIQVYGRLYNKTAEYALLRRINTCK